MNLKKHSLSYFISGIAATITLPIVLLMLSVGLVTFDKDYYYKEYVKYEVGKVQSLSEKDLHVITNNLLSYLGGRQNSLSFVIDRDKSLNRDFFSSQDKSHMVDVRNMYLFLRNLGIFAALVLGISLYEILRKPAYKENIHRFLGTGAILGIIPFLIIGILMMIDFNKYFILFHQLVFTNNLWLMDPAVDNLVNIFPEAFFLDMGIRIISGYIIGLLAVVVLSLATIGKIRKGVK